MNPPFCSDNFIRCYEIVRTISLDVMKLSEDRKAGDGSNYF